MKLSLSIIKEELEFLVLEDNFDNHKLSLNLPRPVFYTDENIFKSDTLYISNAKNLPEHPDFMKGSSLICISKPPNVFFNNKLDLLVIDKDIDILYLSNKIHQIYDKYSSWDTGLQKAIKEWNPLQYIISITEPIFGNGISIMNADYYIIAESELNLASEYEDLDEYGSIPVEQVNLFKNDKRYMEIVKEKEIFIYPNEILPYKCLCKNIFINDEFIFRIIIAETDKEFKEIDTILLEYISEYFEEIALHINTVNEENDSILTSIFKNIISGNSFNNSLFDKELSKIGWKQSDTFRIIHIKPSNYDIYNTTMSYFCSKIMREYNQTYAFIYNDIILVIINIDKISESKKEFFTDFNYFIREGNFRVGFSDYAKGLDNLKEYSLEAEIALEIGLVKNPTIWSHNFSDYIIPYIQYKITQEFSPELLCSPIIKRLQKYDNENQSEYLKTLKLYLDNNMNAIQTAKDLFIHRATIIYRLNRIKEIGKTDLKNKDDLFHLYLSLEFFL